MRHNQQRAAVIIAAVVVAAAIFEIGRSAFAHRSTVADSDYGELERIRAASDAADAPVFVGQDWLGPQARMAWPELGRHDWLARPDVAGLPSFWVLDHRSNRGLPAEIGTDLWPEDPPPVREEQHRAGGLTLTRYTLDSAPISDYLGRTAIGVTLDGEACSGVLEPNAGAVRCGSGRRSLATVSWDLVEVDYRPRACLTLDMPAGGRLELSAPDFVLGESLRGHLGFGDFNARIRNDAPVQIELRHAETTLSREVVSDEQGWTQLSTDVPSALQGSKGLSLQVGAPPMGTWGNRGYSTRTLKRVCLEMRATGGPSL